MSTREEDIERRTEFYNRPNVAKFLSKEGIPKSRSSMSAMMVASGSSEVDSAVDSALFNCLNNVTFSLHPQQINIRDKANGLIIASLRR